jgi:pSer/pThr/pTyr-binding forkhead associated (FHA) protein
MHLPRRIALPERVAGEHDAAAEVCVVLGRFGADVRLDSIRHPAMVSRKHCRLTRDAGGAWWVQDLDTKNGTFLNCRSVRRRTGGKGGGEGHSSAGRARLADGDELCLGTITGQKVTEVTYRLSL